MKKLGLRSTSMLATACLFQELADEAFTDLLKKHGRPTTLKAALKASTRRAPANDDGKPKRIR
jgi:hypothetical protein